MNPNIEEVITPSFGDAVFHCLTKGEKTEDGIVASHLLMEHHNNSILFSGIAPNKKVGTSIGMPTLSVSQIDNTLNLLVYVPTIDIEDVADTMHSWSVFLMQCAINRRAENLTSGKLTFVFAEVTMPADKYDYYFAVVGRQITTGCPNVVDYKVDENYNVVVDDIHVMDDIGL